MGPSGPSLDDRREGAVAGKEWRREDVPRPPVPFGYLP
jgi:hypothetical protein